MEQPRPSPAPGLDPADSRRLLEECALADEAARVEWLLAQLEIDAATRQAIGELAGRLVERVRARAEDQSPLDRFMQQYDLSSEEGVLLMCVAEALLRIPDADTAERLIADKLGDADWAAHLGRSESLFVNASTWGLMLTGRIVRLGAETVGNLRGAVNRLLRESGEPVIRVALRQAMRIMGHQFVMGRSIEEAIKRSRGREQARFRHSFDMLGEAALTAADAERYHHAYGEAIGVIGASHGGADVFAAPGISVKLSALHPRYEATQRERVLAELVPRLRELAVQARAAGIALTVDAEEAERLRLSLDVFEAVLASPELEGWNGFGLAVQAYQKRAPLLLDWLTDRARALGRRIPVRLVKGAYWDSEIKRAQELGLDGYPVFTRKVNTDLSYLVCARRLLAAPDAFYPQFATHNAQTLAAIVHLAGEGAELEFQRLHGMGEELYAEVVEEGGLLRFPCRVYAPVGSHEDLLPYLVRRLLENGANTSFVNRIVDQATPVSELISDPVEQARDNVVKAHPSIPLPRALFAPRRHNSRGLALGYEAAQGELLRGIDAAPPGSWEAQPMLAAPLPPGDEHVVTDPADRARTVGRWRAATPEAVDAAVHAAVEAFPSWRDAPVAQRAGCLEKAADLLEGHLGKLASLAVHEAGKSLADAVAEVREAVDFCRYYAVEARRLLETPAALPGPTGERNTLSLHGRGPFVCISPWNFPLAIFTGQVAAALVTGNPVLAKPAEQTTLMAGEATRLFHAAGVPREVLQLLPGDGADVGAALTRAEPIAGVAFTGSTATARRINQSLAARRGPLAVLIAETGGQNAMIADSSALPEQLVKDVLVSAFGSAGQRCSALRVLFIQSNVAARTLEMLAGAMAELQVGHPRELATDVGPVIDADALERLEAHDARMQAEARLVARAHLPPGASAGHFFAPVAWELEDLGQLEEEVFGPVLHVIRYEPRDLDQVIDAVNATGYGLTLGVHSRIEATAERILARARAGNCYVNRNMIGAMVGVQPFGGEGLSGTGPKAGGPRYLERFCSERTETVNLAAVGGNASLLALGE